MSKVELQAQADTFLEFDLHPLLQSAVSQAGFTKPTPIQQQAIPLVQSGRDVMALAQTGTGKTAAFALPLMHMLMQAEDQKHQNPKVLVLAPTRELAIQIEQEFRTLSGKAKMHTMTIYGGVSDKHQIKELKRFPDIVVACPGRLLDLMQRKEFNSKHIKYLVLDEADQMFDMGFIRDLRKIIRKLPTERQNLLFSATMPDGVRELIQEVLVDPATIEVAHSRPAETVAHAMYPVAQARKQSLLELMLADKELRSAIIFTRTKHRARSLAVKLDKRGHNAIALQGNMSQGQRDRAMQGFRSGKFNILVATDIVARGIDISEVTHVINFDVPMTAEAYTHRIGRTGRAERTGKALTMISPDDRKQVREIEKILGKSVERAFYPDFDNGLAHDDHLEFSTGAGGKKQAHSQPHAHRGHRPGGNNPKHNHRRSHRGPNKHRGQGGYSSTRSGRD